MRSEPDAASVVEGSLTTSHTSPWGLMQSKLNLTGGWTLQGYFHVAANSKVSD
jgi:hypothetical protein